VKAALALIAVCSWAIVGQVQPPATTPSTAPSLSPPPTPQPTPTIAMLPPDAPPQILFVRFSSLAPRAGDVVFETVLTSSNVASVEIRAGGYGWNLPKTDVGHFEGQYNVPSLPFFVSHNLVLQIIARNTAGVAAVSTVAMQIR
jgi:hypothetical protein